MSPKLLTILALLCLAPVNLAQPLSYNSGPLLSNVLVNVVYWAYTADQVPGYNIFPAFYQGIITSTYFNVLSQYGIHPGVGVGGYFLMFGATGALTASQIEAGLVNAISSGAVPQPTSNTLYAIHFGSIVTSVQNDKGGGGCGWHNVFKGTAYGDLVYAAIPWLGNSTCGQQSGARTVVEQTTLVASHELFEAVTDPYPPSGWTAQNGEISDLCQPKGGYVTTSTGQYWVQPAWSNQGGGSCLTAPSSFAEKSNRLINRINKHQDPQVLSPRFEHNILKS